MIKVWSDNRTGPTGCLAGNLVLRKIQQIDGEKIVHEKGTVFSTSTKKYVGRVCSSDRYLQPGIVHFCNMSINQAQNVDDETKIVLFLFITISGNLVHYWTVPKELVERVLKNARPKLSSSTCFLRITEKNHRFFLGDRDITQHHRTLPMRGRVTKSTAAQVAAQISSSKIPENIKINGQRFKLTPMEAVTA